MCTTCAALRPLDPLATNDNHLTGSHTGTHAIWDIEMFAGGVDLRDTRSAAAFSIDQIASQLTDGYWNADFGSRRAFDLGADRTLTVDLTGLELADVRTITRMAFEAWRDVTGIRFVEVGATAADRNEGADAPNDFGTTAQTVIGADFNGNIASVGDIDLVKVRIEAGKVYTIDLAQRGSETLDAYLRIYSGDGSLLAQDDDSGADTNSQIIFNATSTGDIYLQASAFENRSAGGYTLSINEQADITFDDEEEGAFATSELSGTTILSSFVNLQQGWSDDPISMNGYWYQTMVHEIGHALGLGHAGNYNGNATWGVDNNYDNDSWQATVMSYFAQGENDVWGPEGTNPNIGASYAYLATLMPADIIAIQNLYGSNFSTRADNTIYGNNSNVTGSLGQMMDQVFGTSFDTTIINAGLPVALTIFDTGGIDVMDFSGTSARQLINLYALGMSNVYGLLENVQIARGVVIEGAIGGRGNDRLIGNSVANNLIGNAGNDWLQGNTGDDTLSGGISADRLDGGTGLDMANYARSTARVDVDLRSTAAGTGEARGDIFVAIEGLRGSAYSDRIFGNGSSNNLQGMGGNDALSGREGNDTLFGMDGIDTLSGGAGNDMLFGGTGADRFIFDGGADIIRDFANNSDLILLDRDVLGIGNRSISAVLSTFGQDIGSAVLLRFAGGQTLRIDGLANVSSLSDDLALF